MAKKLTQITAAQAKAAESRREVADGGCPGLYLAIHPTGAKAWTLRFRSPVERDSHGQRAARKLTLGSFASEASKDAPRIGQPLTLTQARSLATAALETVRRGVDPTHTRREEKAEARDDAIARSANTVEAAMAEFLKRYKGKKKRGLRDSTRNLTAHYFGLKADLDKPGEWKKTDPASGVLKRWAGRPLASITKGDVIALLNALVDDGKGVTANRVLTNLKTFFGWCLRQHDMLAVSPAALVDAPAAEEKRERVLNAAELRAIWKAAGSDPFGHMVKLLLLTGARRDELREAPWAEFDMDARIEMNGISWQGPLWTLPAERSKNGKAHLVPLSDAAVAALQGMPRIKGKGLLFTLNGHTPISDLSKRKKRLDAASGVSGWTLHDLRRTFYSGLQGLGFSIEVCDACVNHTSSIRGAAAHYAWHRYLPEKTAALEAWARHVDTLLNGRTPAGDNVVALHGARQ